MAKNNVSRVGPVLALAQITQGFPVHETRSSTYEGHRFVEQVDIRRGRRCAAQIISIAAGSIKLDRVKPAISLSIGQMRSVVYSAIGDVEFAKAQVGKDERDYLHALLEYPGTLLVVGGHLARVAGVARFDLESFAWDIAEAPFHAPDRPFDPACGLTYESGRMLPPGELVMAAGTAGI